jgi:hypothetical protein
MLSSTIALKNLLATVSAIATRTKDASHSMDDFVAALDSCICSMASAHELLSGSRWEGVHLRELVRRELVFLPEAIQYRLQIPAEWWALLAWHAEAKNVSHPLPRLF